jgi:serine/threonine protein kinase
MTQVGDGPRIFRMGEAFRQYPYTIERFIGEGVSGEVYAIRHHYTNDLSALKVGHVAERANAKRIAQHLAEALAVYRIHHHNVVRVLDLACEPDGMVWQRMELLDGCSIEELLLRHGRFTPIRAIDVLVEAAFGLHEAHEHQIIHRDIHPGNVFVTARGTVKVLDFSLAKIIPAGLETTRSHRTAGAIAYMSPEQIDGGPATPQFDVFAAGMLFWQMLTGRPPFGGATNTMELVRRKLTEAPESLVTAAGLPAYVDDVLRRAIARDPAMRFDGMWSLVQALRDVRERLLADPAAALLREPALWERQNPLALNPEGHTFYRAPRSLPRDSPAPHVPSARIVVSPAARGPVAPPLPMAAIPFPVPVPVPGQPGPVDVAALTVRARPPPARRPPWALLLIASALLVLGATLWLVLTWDASAAPAPRTPAPAGRR